jgi:molecular chaperone Hsp33
MSDAEQKMVEEFTKVESIFVRGRNCLLLQADFSPIFVDYYLHLMQHNMRNEETEDTVLKKLLAYFTLHLVSRPWQEYHAWTLNVCTPRLANYFISGSSLTEDVVGRAFREGVRETETNMLFTQNLLPNKEPQTSVITLPCSSVEDWVQDYYRQSEQRQSRAFDLGNDKFALITAQPDADYDWLQELTTEDILNIREKEQVKLLETRKFKFRCGCTVEKVLPVVRAMMRDFADQLSEQGFLEISCPRCGATFKVTPEMVMEQNTPE